MSKPKLQLEKSYGYYHLFIGNMHDPKLCPACIEPGIWPIEATGSPKPVKGNGRTTDPARASSEPEGKPNE